MTLDRALDFYNNYARYVGFDTRKKGSKKEKEVTTWIYVVCSREGTQQRKSEQSELKRKRSSIKCYCNAKVSWKYIMGVGYVIQSFVEEHNHEMVEGRHKRFMNLNRNLDLVHQKFILDCANANIGPTLSFSLLKEVLGGLDYVGCTLLGVRNYRRDLRAYVEGADAQMLLNEMRRKKELCSAFTYEFEVNSKDRLTRLFWCDPTARRNYHLYGDIVSFDTTYSTNRYCMIFAPFTGKDNHGRPVTFAAGLLSKENANSFSWLFNQFVKCMGVAPKLIVTDQDLGMKVAVEEVLVNTRHRWCMRHVMNKVADKLPKNMLGSEQLKKELNACVWSELIEPDAFEETWHAIMERYGLANNVWFSSMFATRKFWVPAFFRDFPMSSLIKTTSISESQNSFFKRFPYPNSKNGIRHTFYFAPSQHWTTPLSLKSPLVKVVHVVQYQDVVTHVYVDEKKKAQPILLGEILGLYQAVCVDIDQIHELTSIVREARQKIFADGVVTSTAQKNKLIEEFYGTGAPQEVDVQPPEVVSTKGSEKQLRVDIDDALDDVIPVALEKTIRDRLAEIGPSTSGNQGEPKHQQGITDLLFN
ncbi:protein FAR1-RELATED SEQUENCE 5-like [Salvia splendens]|uniref:protein FAR1-RELATED SEQUENCE 5-like n=1 Tax=Salvia splendens TaxID=180675 RepID=UPI001C263CBA|nr:protein FAR1-RELATED SEQUENCE 5-like [Salvia splendens]